MSSWSRQRRFMYGGVVAAIIIVITGLLSWKLFYRAPNCFDGIKNGKEAGIDCGGACEKICPSAFLSPQVQWSRFERVTNGIYNVATYIVNPNPDVKAFDAPYHMQIFDDKGVLITEYNGVVNLPPHRNTLAFRGSLNVGQRIPSKAIFEFTKLPEWQKAEDQLSQLVVIDKQYNEDINGSSLNVSLKNNSAKLISRLSVYAILYDSNGNSVGFSKTIVDNIASGSTVLAPFTWPTNRNGSVVSIEVLPVAE